MIMIDFFNSNIMDQIPIVHTTSMMVQTNQSMDLLAEVVPTNAGVLLGSELGNGKRHKCNQCDFSTDATAYLTIHVRRR